MIKRSLVFIGLLMITVSVACNFSPTGDPDLRIVTSSPIPASPLPATSRPTVTPFPTLIRPTTKPVTPTIPPTPRVGQPLPQTTQVKIFLVALNDNGASGSQIGCGDSLVAVTRTIPTPASIKATLEQLFSVKTQFYGESGLYNALYQSNLTVQNITNQNGTFVIELVGTLQLGGECDNPRVESQLLQTAGQFGNPVNILLNGTPLHDALSLK